MFCTRALEGEGVGALEVEVAGLVGGVLHEDICIPCFTLLDCRNNMDGRGGKKSHAVSKILSTGQATSSNPLYDRLNYWLNDPTTRRSPFAVGTVHPARRAVTTKQQSSGGMWYHTWYHM